MVAKKRRLIVEVSKGTLIGGNTKENKKAYAEGFMESARKHKSKYKGTKGFEFRFY